MQCFLILSFQSDGCTHYLLASGHYATVSNKNSIFHNLNYITETIATFKRLMVITVIALQ